MIGEICRNICTSGAITGYLLAFVIYFKMESNGANKVLAATTFVLATRLFAYYLSFTGLSGPVVTLLIEIAILKFLFWPLCYFYVCLLTSSKKEIGRRDLLQLLPFGVYYAVVVTIYVAKGDAWVEAFAVSGLWTTYLRGMFGIGYSVAMLMVVTAYNNNTIRFFSSLEKVNLRWLYIIILLYLFTWIVGYARWILFEGLHIMNSEYIYIVMMIVMLSGMSGWVYFVGYNTITQPDIFTLSHEMNDAIENIETKKFDATQAEKPVGQIDKLLNYMRENEPFVKPDITLSSLAGEVKIPSYLVSQMINKQLDQNFYMFINRYRIDKAKKLLQSEEGKNILQIAYESGFNSKSVFNTCFKKLTGMTPTEYRQSGSDGPKEETGL